MEYDDFEPDGSWFGDDHDYMQADDQERHEAEMAQVAQRLPAKTVRPASVVA